MSHAQLGKGLLSWVRGCSQQAGQHCVSLPAGCWHPESFDASFSTTPPAPQTALTSAPRSNHPNPQSARRYNVSYVYHSLYAYFSRDNVALPGIAAFFKKASGMMRGPNIRKLQRSAERSPAVAWQQGVLRGIAAHS